MTVQELIDTLNSIKDKTKIVCPNSRPAITCVAESEHNVILYSAVVFSERCDRGN